MKRVVDLHWAFWLVLPGLFFGVLWGFAALDPEGYLAFFEGKSAAFELLVALLPVIAAGFAFGMLRFPVVHTDKRLVGWILLLLILPLILAAEDLGWGRDILDIGFPDWWPGADEETIIVVPQTAAGLDKEAIRALLQAVAVGVGFLFPILSWILPPNTGQVTFFRLIWPTFICIPVLLCSVLSRLPREIAQAKLNIPEIEQISHSEVGEMFIYFFLLYYCASLFWRLKQIQKG